MLTCATCAGCTISDCLNTEAVATGEAQLTLQNSKFVNIFNEGFTDGGALAVEKATSALLTNITFTGTSGFDVIARDPEASIYTDTLNAFEINPSGEGKVLPLARAPAREPLLSETDDSFLSLQQVRYTLPLLRAAATCSSWPVSTSRESWASLVACLQACCKHKCTHSLSEVARCRASPPPRGLPTRPLPPPPLRPHLIPQPRPSPHQRRQTRQERAVAEATATKMSSLAPQSLR